MYIKVGGNLMVERGGPLTKTRSLIIVITVGGNAMAVREV